MKAAVIDQQALRYATFSNPFAASEDDVLSTDRAASTRVYAVIGMVSEQAMVNYYPLTKPTLHL